MDKNEIAITRVSNGFLIRETRWGGRGEITPGDSMAVASTPTQLADWIEKWAAGRQEIVE